jgi:spore coat protein U-like protein
MAFSTRSCRRVGLLSVLVFAVSGIVQAATDTDTLTVTATVTSGCALTGGTLAFGTYVSGQGTDLDATGAINYANCAAGTLTFALDGGSSGNAAARTMKAGSASLNYQIFRNSTRTSNWGSGAEAQTVTLLTTTGGSVTVYGRIPKSQTVAAGSYTDTVTITLTF